MPIFSNTTTIVLYIEAKNIEEAEKLLSQKYNWDMQEFCDTLVDSGPVVWEQSPHIYLVPDRECPICIHCGDIKGACECEG